mmetsp:Transcript_10336/g.24892  ORF Transcript_10336/g.24892 Transcript_10336/m.24892 type:complete len:283 (+) Transcript_10336:59-907(+)
MMEDPDEHASLVKKVKQVQRESEEGKQQWWAFCEFEGKNNRRDPQRHTLHSLRRFFHLRDQGGLPKLRLGSSQPDPETHQYWVQKLKDAQRLSSDLRQKWWDYCDKQSGGFRDPQRHSTKSIQTFFEFYAGQYGTPPLLAAAAATGLATDKAAALAAVSTVTAITVSGGQKAYVVQLQEPVSVRRAQDQRTPESPGSIPAHVTADQAAHVTHVTHVTPAASQVVLASSAQGTLIPIQLVQPAFHPDLASQPQCIQHVVSASRLETPAVADIAPREQSRTPRL